jgi:O-antigen/teichoic acid export membrane protein
MKINLKYISKLANQSIIKVLATAFGIYSTGWIIRNTTESRNADFAFVVSIVSILLAVINLGIPKLIHKYYTNINPETEENRLKLSKIWKSFFFLRIVSFFVGLFLAFFVGLFFYPNLIILITSIFIIQFIFIFDESFRGITDANGHTIWYTITDFLEKVFLFGFLIIYELNIIPSFLKLEALNYFIICSFATRIVMIISDYFLNKKFIYKGGKVDWKFLKSIQKTILTISLSGISVGIFMNIRQIILEYFNFSDSQLVTFFNANKLLVVMTIIPSITIPMISSTVKKQFLGKDQKMSNIFRFLLIILGFSVVYYLGIYIFSPFLYKLIDIKGQYSLREFLQIFRIIVLSIIFYPLSLFIGNILILINKEKYEFISTLWVGILSIPIYILATYFFGILGMSVSISMVMLLDLLIKLYLLKIKIVNNPETLNNPKI